MVRALVKEEIRQGRWDQGSWSDGMRLNPETELREPTCGTTACVAGWAVIADRGQFVDSDAVIARSDDDPDEVVDNWYHVKGKPVDTVSVKARARQLLGLTYDEAEYLFRGHRDEDEIMTFLKARIKAARKERKEKKTA
jgi:hypothetical protein